MDLKKIYSLLYRDFTPKAKIDREMRRGLTAVKHENGFLYASNGFLLAKVDCGYAEKLEGKTLFSDGEEYDGRPVNYAGVIPCRATDDVDMTGSVEDLKKAVNLVYRVTNMKVKEKLPAVISFGRNEELADEELKRITYRADWLRSAFQLFKLLDEDFSVKINGASSEYLMLEGIATDSLVMLTPLLVPLEKKAEICPVFTIEEALNYVSETKQKANWYE